MSLHKLKEFYPHYQGVFGGDNFKTLTLYTGNDEKIGLVEDILVDDDGHFRYLVLGFSPLGLGKKILLPIGLAQIDYDTERAYVDGLNKEHIEHLPGYTEGVVIDHEHEKYLRVLYCTPASSIVAEFVESAIPTDPSKPLDTVKIISPDAVGEEPKIVHIHSSDIYSYDQDPLLYTVNESIHGSFKQLEARLKASQPRVSS